MPVKKLTKLGHFNIMLLQAIPSSALSAYHRLIECDDQDKWKHPIEIIADTNATELWRISGIGRASMQAIVRTCYLYDSKCRMVYTYLGIDPAYVEKEEI